MTVVTRRLYIEGKAFAVVRIDGKFATVDCEYLKEDGYMLKVVFPSYKSIYDWGRKDTAIEAIAYRTRAVRYKNACDKMRQEVGRELNGKETFRIWNEIAEAI